MLASVTSLARVARACVVVDMGVREPEQRPLFELGLRLAEGRGAALVKAVIDAAQASLHDLATFDAAGVSDSGA